MKLIDTHCHLNDAKLLPEVDRIIRDAINNGVAIMQVVGYDLESSLEAIHLAEQYDEIFAIIGIHPTEIKNDIDNQLMRIEELGKHPKVIAIGETGLDFYWQKSNEQHKLQKEIFNKHIDIANHLRLPIVVHSRDAIEATLELLKQKAPKYGGVMHCYSGPKELVSSFVALGLYISLAGPVTFLNARVPKDVATIVPSDRLLIETDSPYLAPHPYRGKQNEPQYLPRVAEAIATLRRTTLVEVANMTTDNATRLFHGKHL
ncbi:MAG TPA: hydrolase TatD [Firmicutes bacterium]|jgi:TatD DNase family protein|nr:hydrolase TatD [Bacillota bacterium]